MTLLLFAVPMVVLALIRRRLQPVLRSPVWVVTLIMTTLGIAGYLLCSRLAGVGGGTISVDLSQETIDETGVFIASSIIFLTLGATIASRLAPPTDSMRIGFRAIVANEKQRAYLLPVAFLPFILILTGGVHSLLIRTTYFTTSGKSSLASFGILLGIGAVAAMGYLVATERGGRRVVAIFGTILYITLFFSLASRRFALLPVCFALGIYVATMSRRAKLGLLGAGCLAAWLLPLPLFLRGQDTHGLIPYLAALPAYLNSDVEWLFTLNNVLIYFPIAALTSTSQHIPWSYLLVELNPIPGKFTNWYVINKTLGLNRYTPFAGVGEIRNVGWSAIAIVWCGIGMVLTYLDRQIGRLIAVGQQVAAVAMLGFCSLFAIAILQYNVRNAQRNLIYSLLIGLAIEIGPRLLINPSASQGCERHTMASQGQSGMSKDDQFGGIGPHKQESTSASRRPAVPTRPAPQ